MSDLAYNLPQEDGAFGSIYIRGNMYTVGYDHEDFDEIVELITAYESVDSDIILDSASALEIDDYVDETDEILDNLEYLLDTNRRLASESSYFSVEDEVLTFEGVTINHKFIPRVKRMEAAGQPVEAFKKMLLKLESNPGFSARNELPDFLCHLGIPLTSDGDFLAYKVVNKEFRDKYSRTFDNTPGNVVEEPRNRVDDNREHACSKGLHAGTLEYVNSYGSKVAGDRIIIVKINPMDVVSIPTDYSCQKLRTCKYYVVKEYPEGWDARHLSDEVYDYGDDEYNM